MRSNGKVLFVLSSSLGQLTMTTDWDFFDKIYCISLEERTDRRQEAMVQFERVGLTGRVEFVIVQKHPSDCEAGIYESHMLCMRKGLSAGARHILIFEDDIIFDRFSSAALRQNIAFLATGTQWNMWFAGCMIKALRPTQNPAVAHIRFRSLSHAYAVYHGFAERLLTHSWKGISFDAFIKNLHDDHTYAACPAFAFQSASRSDNSRYLPLDRFRRLCGGLHLLQKSNEFYRLNRWRIIAAHLIALVLLLLYLK